MQTAKLKSQRHTIISSPADVRKTEGGGEQAREGRAGEGRGVGETGKGGRGEQDRKGRAGQARAKGVGKGAGGTQQGRERKQTVFRTPNTKSRNSKM